MKVMQNSALRGNLEAVGEAPTETRKGACAPHSFA